MAQGKTYDPNAVLEMMDRVIAADKAKNQVPEIDPRTGVFTGRYFDQREGDPNTFAAPKIQAHLAYLRDQGWDVSHLAPGQQIPEFTKLSQPDPYQSQGLGDSLKNIGKLAYNESLTGLAQQAITGDVPFDLTGFDPNMVEQIAGQIGSFVMPLDLAALFVGGGIGGAAGKVAVREGFKLGGTALAKSAVRQVVKRGVASAVTLGTYEGARGFFEGKTKDGEYDPVDFFKGFGKGAVMGGAIGATGGLAAPFGKAAELGAEFVTMGTAMPLVEGRAPTVNDYASAAGFLAGMKLMGALGSTASKTFERTRKAEEKRLAEEFQRQPGLDEPAKFNESVKKLAHEIVKDDPNFDQTFIQRIEKAADGEEVGVFGDFVRGAAKRNLTKDALNTPVKVSRPPEGTAPGEYVAGWVGRDTDGRYKIFVNNERPNDIAFTLAHEAAHIMRVAAGERRNAPRPLDTPLAEKTADDLASFLIGGPQKIGEGKNFSVNSRVKSLATEERVAQRAYDRQFSGSNEVTFATESIAEKVPKVVQDTLSRIVPYWGKKGSRKPEKISIIRGEGDASLNPRQQVLYGGKSGAVVASYAAKGKAKSSTLQLVDVAGETLAEQKKVFDLVAKKAVDSNQNLYFSDNMVNTQLFQSLVRQGIVSESRVGNYYKADSKKLAELAQTVPDLPVATEPVRKPLLLPAPGETAFDRRMRAIEQRRLGLPMPSGYGDNFTFREPVAGEPVPSRPIRGSQLPDNRLLEAPRNMGKGFTFREPIPGEPLPSRPLPGSKLPETLMLEPPRDKGEGFTFRDVKPKKPRPIKPGKRVFVKAETAAFTPDAYRKIKTREKVFARKIGLGERVSELADRFTPDFMKALKNRLKAPEAKKGGDLIIAADNERAVIAGNFFERAADLGLQKLFPKAFSSPSHRRELHAEGVKLAEDIQAGRRPEWNKLLDDIWRQAKEAGINLGYVGLEGQQKYLSRILKKDIREELYTSITEVKKRLAEAGDVNPSDAKVVRAIEAKQDRLLKVLEHLKKTGQIKSMADGLADLERNVGGQMHRTASFTQRRKLKLPSDFYETDARVIIPEYLSGMSQRIAEARTFGPKYEKIDALVDKLGKVDLEQRDLLVKAYTLWNGTYELKHGLRGRVKEAADLFTMWEVATKIGLGQATVLNAGQPFISFIPDLGLWSAVRGGAKYVTDPNFRSFVKRSGVQQHDILHAALGLRPTGIMGKFSDFTSRASGFVGINRLLLNWAAATAHDSIGRWAKIGEREGRRGEWARERLADFGLKPGPIGEKDMLKAMYRFATDSQLQKNYLNDPLFLNSPGVRPFVLFKRFGIRQGLLIKDMIKKEAARGNYMPLVRLAAGGWLAGTGITFALNKMKTALGGEPIYEKDDSAWEAVINGIASIGAFGMAGDLLAFENVSEIPNKIGFMVKPVAFSDMEQWFDTYTQFLKDWEEYGDGWLATKRNAYKMFGGFGTYPRQLAKRLATEGQMDRRQSRFKGEERSQIFDFLLAGEAGKASNRLKLWNKNNPDNPIAMSDVSPSEILSYLKRKSEAVAEGAGDKRSKEYREALRKEFADRRKQLKNNAGTMNEFVRSSR